MLQGKASKMWGLCPLDAFRTAALSVLPMWPPGPFAHVHSVKLSFTGVVVLWQCSGAQPSSAAATVHVLCSEGSTEQNGKKKISWL